MAINSGRNRFVGAEGNMAFSILLVLILVGVDARGFDEQRQAPLSQPFAKVIQTTDGDIFDCVDIYKQPAFDHPLLKNHQLQMRPSSYPEDLPENDSQETLHVPYTSENEECPEGTVPIMRVDKDVQQMKDIPVPNFQSQHWMQNASASNGGGIYFAGIKTHIADVYGGAADLDAYAIPNVRESQMSSVSIVVTDQDIPTQTRYSVLQAGLMVNPSLSHDNNTRVYIHWTTDAFQNTGCYNTLCPGFVLTGKVNHVGAVVSPLSVYKGQQYVTRMLIYKDKVSGNWWFAFGGYSDVVGYWPKEIFTNFDKGRQVAFGGYVRSPPGIPLPPMGNGHYPEEPNYYSCFIKDVAYVDVNGALQDLTAEGQHAEATNRKCYSVGYYWEKYHMFRFGGTGAC